MPLPFPLDVSPLEGCAEWAPEHSVMALGLGKAFTDPCGASSGCEPVSQRLLVESAPSAPIDLVGLYAVVGDTLYFVPQAPLVRGPPCCREGSPQLTGVPD